MQTYRNPFCRRGRGRSFHVDGSKTEKAREPTVESGARNLEAGSIRSGDESTGGLVKLKTITEIRQSSARNASVRYRFGSPFSSKRLWFVDTVL